MQNWKEYYSLASKKISCLASNDLGVLLGFNVNIDKVTKISPKDLSELSKKMNLNHKKIEQPNSHVISTKNELINALLYSMHKGTADERIIS
ncbi:MAG: ADP-dependent glucokinase/phosphofructokinase, partial [Candidatus Heimdallarchaeaceae archaeon]